VFAPADMIARRRIEDSEDCRRRGIQRIKTG